MAGSIPLTHRLQVRGQAIPLAGIVTATPVEIRSTGWIRVDRRLFRLFRYPLYTLGACRRQPAGPPFSENCFNLAAYAATGINPVAQVFFSLYCVNSNAGGGGGVSAAPAVPPQPALPASCHGLPDGVVMAVSVGSAAGIGGGLSGQIVVNMNTGQVSLFGSYSVTASGIATPSASAEAGSIWGLGQSNCSYFGPFTSVNAGAGIIAASLATTSQGLTNPFNLSIPTSATAGIQTPSAGFSYGVAQYSNPVNIGDLKNPLFNAAFSAFLDCLRRSMPTISYYQGLCGSTVRQIDRMGP